MSINLLTSIYKGLKASGALNYVDDGIRLLNTKVSTSMLGAVEKIGLVSSIGTLATGAMAGQAEGSFGDYFTGFLDLGQDQFREDGGTQTGSRKKEVGKIMQNVALGALSFIPAGRLTAKFGVNAVKSAYKAIAGWQLATVASDRIWSDNGGLVEETTDAVTGLASAARFAKLLAVL